MVTFSLEGILTIALDSFGAVRALCEVKLIVLFLLIQISLLITIHLVNKHLLRVFLLFHLLCVVVDGLLHGVFMLSLSLLSKVFG